MKILQLGKFHPIRGGVEKVMLDLTAGLSQRGIGCDMLCASLDGSYEIPLNSHGRIIATRSAAKIKATMISPAMVLRLRKICSSYDIIHIHHPDPMAALALRLSGFKGKVVLHWHSDILRQRQLLRLIRPLQSWLLRRADAIVTTSPAYLEASPWLAPFRGKCRCIPIGIDPLPEATAERVRALRNRYDNRRIVFSLGRLVSYKGFEYLIDAARLLPDDVVVLIGGTGPLHDEMQHRIDSAGLSGKVMLIGYVADEDLPVYYRAASLFCMSSVERTEAFGVVLIEAMSCATPVVATDIPGSGVPWVNADGVSGKNASPRSSESLAHAISDVLSDRSGSYSDKAHERYRSLFTGPQMISSVLSLYKELL